MSAYIENNLHNNYSPILPTCDKNISTKKLSQSVKLWMSRSKQRKQLAKLDARMLMDIGITPEQAKLEIKKPFWK